MIIIQYTICLYIATIICSGLTSSSADVGQKSSCCFGNEISVAAVLLHIDITPPETGGKIISACGYLTFIVSILAHFG